jgi:hypothetical protein
MRVEKQKLKMKQLSSKNQTLQQVRNQKSTCDAKKASNRLMGLPVLPRDEDFERFWEVFVSD